LRLDGARLAIFTFGDIKDHSMGMELRGNISVYWASCVVLELRCNELSCRFGRVVPADSGLRIVFELFNGCADALAVRLTHPMIASDKSCQ
jgi:hypothetical protein